MDITIKIANRDEIDAVWAIYGARMQRGCDRTGNTISAAELWTMVRSGQCFLVFGWGEKEVLFAAVWRTETLPTGPALRCMGVAGVKSTAWIGPHFEFMAEQARQNGVTRILGNGRHGWSRALARHTGRKVRVISEEFEVI